MDHLLRDIRDFLWKLDSGQLEIEAGQRELHRDIDNLKNSFGQLVKLKENLEDVKISNERQSGMIRDLEAKLDLLESEREDQRKNPESETSVENRRENSRCSSDGSRVVRIQDRNARRSRAIRFQKMTSNTSTVRKTTSALKKKEFKEESQRSSAVCVPSSCCCAARILPLSGLGDSSMLQRYLKDSVKYCDDVSVAGGDIYGDPGRGGPRPGPADGDRGRRTEESAAEAEVGRRGRPPGRAGHFCVVCRKVFGSKDLLKTHKEFHCKATRRPNVKKCSYCKLARGSPASLSLHSRKCRLIRRSRRNK